jgi:hypothetical protein
MNNPIPFLKNQMFNHYNYKIHKKIKHKIMKLVEINVLDRVYVDIARQIAFPIANHIYWQKINKNNLKSAYNLLTTLFP